MLQVSTKKEGVIMGLVIDGHDVKGLSLGGNSFYALQKNDDGSITVDGQKYSASSGKPEEHVLNWGPNTGDPRTSNYDQVNWGTNFYHFGEFLSSFKNKYVQFVFCSDQYTPIAITYWIKFDYDLGSEFTLTVYNHRREQLNCRIEQNGTLYVPQYDNSYINQFAIFWQN